MAEVAIVGHLDVGDELEIVGQVDVGEEVEIVDLVDVADEVEIVGEVETDDEVEIVDEVPANPLKISVQRVRQNFYADWVGRLTANNDASQQPQVSYEQLNNKQQRVVDLVREHMVKGREEMLKDPLLLILQGEAGN